jgi:hypothetical protein
MSHKMGKSIVMQQHNAIWQLISAFTLQLVMQHLIPMLVEIWTLLSQDITCFQSILKTFALWFSVVDLCSVTNGIEAQKHVSLFMIPFWNAVRFVQTVVPVLFLELFWNTSCTGFVEVKSVLDDFISRTGLICIWFALRP